MEERPTTAYVEVQIDEDSISLSLITEGYGMGPNIEETERLTFDELREMGGEYRTLRLSRDTRSKLESMSAKIDLLELQKTSGIEEGDVLTDDNPAPWSNDTRVVVEEVTDEVAEDYVIQETNTFPNDTVATANPSYPADDTVVLGHYEGSNKTYAFPESRLVETEPSGTTCTPAWNDN